MVNFRVQYKDLLGMFGYFMKDVPIDIMEKDFSDEEIGKAFGVSIKAFRTGKKISLRKMEEDIAIPAQTINRYENNKIIPTISQAFKISAYFQVPLDMFVLLGLANIFENADILKNWELFHNVYKQAGESFQKFKKK